jgi:hypothetical protein
MDVREANPPGRLSRQPETHTGSGHRSRLPIEDGIAKFTEIQADHPSAQIRQGKRNGLEIWPSINAFGL